MNRAVFLDRDGVINRAIIREGKPYPPATVKELEIVPGAAEALTRLRDAGFVLIVVTNQPDVARGKQRRQAVEAINGSLREQLPIDDFIVCYHDDQAACSCRKPRPGAILEAAARHHVDVTRSSMIGDRWRDIAGGQQAGCRSYFIDYHYAERQPDQSVRKVQSLSEAVDHIISRSEENA